jgi:hypothetical protein
MTELEDRLRTVTRAAAEQITPDRIGPLRSLPRRHLFAITGLFRPARSPRWLAPAATATAALALVAGSVTVAHAIGSHPPATAPGDGGSGAVPPYYVGLIYSAKAGSGVAGDIVVRATATGRALATITPPRGQEFTAVSSAASDRTFVLATETTAEVAYRMKHQSTQIGLAAADGPERFYLLQLGDTGAPSRLVPLNIPVNPDESDFSLSPAGTELAVALSSEDSLAVQVYSLATGTARAWTTSTHLGGKYRYSLVGFGSWTSGGLLTVGLDPARSFASGLAGLLNTATPGGSLTADLVTIPWSCTGSITLNGNLLVTGTTSPGGSIPWILRECSYSYGRTRVTVPGRTLYYHGRAVDLDGPFWLSPNGSTIIEGGMADWTSVHSVPVVGLLAGNQIRALPGSATIPQVSPFPGNAVAW